MWGRLKTLALAAVVAAAAIVPLFGDPRQTPVTHALWARMLLRAMGMNEAVRASATASQVFSTLAWRDSLSLPAERFLRASGASVEGGALTATGASPAEVTYALAVVQPGDYQLRARLAGPAGQPATAEVVRLSGGAPLKSFTLDPAPEGAWVLGGSAHLDPGAYGAQFLIPAGCSLREVEVAPPCVNSIEPAGGWQPAAVTSVADVAVTALKAMEAEHELPPAASPVELTGAEFQVEAPEEAIAARSLSPGLEAMTLRAQTKGLRAIVSVEVPEAGLYSVSALVAPGAGQRWLVDGCRKAVVCAASGRGWRPILSQTFAAGRHHLQLTLADGASVERVRFERKKDSPADYLATLKRLGFDAGPDGPVARGTALDAARFVSEQRRALIGELCGDAVPFDERAAPTVADLGGATAPVPPPVEPPGPVEPPIGPPILPPQPPATPTTPGGGD
jgi:hypothetical protein